MRKAFEAGLAVKSRSDLKLTDFFLACAAYIVFSMDRLHVQDQFIHDLLKERISTTDTGAHERLDTLNDRQNQSREMVERFQQASRKLAHGGSDALAFFEEEARIFVDQFTSLMAPRKNPFQSYTDELFSDEDWTLIAGVTDESLAAERDLYAAVKTSAPGDVDPETIAVTYH